MRNGRVNKVSKLFVRGIEAICVVVKFTVIVGLQTFSPQVVYIILLDVCICQMKGHSTGMALVRKF